MQALLKTASQVFRLLPAGGVTKNKLPTQELLQDGPRFFGLTNIIVEASVLDLYYNKYNVVPNGFGLI
jgi:hypothetical protein